MNRRENNELLGINIYNIFRSSNLDSSGMVYLGGSEMSRTTRFGIAIFLGLIMIFSGVSMGVPEVFLGLAAGLATGLMILWD